MTDLAVEKDDDPLLSIQQVADHLKVPVKSIYTWRATGKPSPPAIKVGKHLRFRWSEL